MRLVVISTPFCLRKDVGHASDGFFFVSDGILVLRDDTKRITIYESETFQTNGGYNSVPAIQSIFELLHRSNSRKYTALG